MKVTVHGRGRDRGHGRPPSRLLDYLWLELAASNAVDAAVERTHQLEITRLQRNIDYTAKEHTQGRGSFYRPV